MKSFEIRQAFIAFVGAVVSVYLLFHFVQTRSGFELEPSICAINAAFDCDRVAKSPFAELFGVPIAGYGLMFYLAYLLLLLVGAPEGAEPEGAARAKRADVRLFLAGLTLPVSLILGLLSEFSLGTLCLFCVLLYLVNIALFILALKDPARTGNAGQSLRSGAREFFSLFSGGGAASIRRWPLSGFVAAEVVFVLLLPTVFMEGYLEPRARERFSRAVLKDGFQAWRAAPAVAMPDFNSSGNFGPDVVFGNPQAKVTVIEFSDMECPACHKYAPYLEEGLQRYRDKVRFVFKHFPIDMSCNRAIEEEKHKYACTAARMAVCAGAQDPGALWKFVESVFELRDIDLEILNAEAKRLNLKPDVFEECVKGKESLERVKADIELGLAAGIISTPSIFINRKPLHVPPRFFEGILGLIIEEVEKG